MKKKGKNHTVSVWIVWMISYFIVFFLPSAVFAGVFHRMYTVIKTEIQGKNDLLLDKTKLHVDSIFSRMDDIAGEVNYSSTLFKLQSVKNGLSGRERYQLIQMSDELSVYIRSYDMFKKCFLYFSRFDLIVSDSSSVPSSTFYQACMEGNGAPSYHEFINSITGNFKGEYFVLNMNGKEYVAYAKSLPFHVLNSRKDNFVLMMEMDYIRRELEMDDTAMLIVKPDGSVLFRNIESSYENCFTVEDFTEPYGLLVKNDVTVSYIKSDVNDMVYVMLYPNELFWNKLDRLKTVGLACFFGCFVLVFLLTFYFIRWNYVPLKQLLQQRPRNRKEWKVHLKEYEGLRTMLSQFRAEKRELLSEVRQHREYQQRECLNRLLCDKKDAGSAALRLKDKFGIGPDRCSYRLAVFRITDIGSVFREDYKKDAADTVELAAFVTENILQELLQEGKIYRTLCEDTIVLIVCRKDADKAKTEDGGQESDSLGAGENSDAAGGLGPAFSKAEEACTGIADFMKKQFDIELEYLLSSECGKMEELPILYEEITKMRELQTRMAQDRILSRRIKKYVEDHYPDPGLGLAAIAAEMGYSAGYVSKKFKSEEGKNLVEYINEYRIQITVGRMKEDGQKEQPLEQIAKEAGFLNYRTYARTFTAILGISPGKYRESMK